MEEKGDPAAAARKDAARDGGGEEDQRQQVQQPATNHKRQRTEDGEEGRGEGGGVGGGEGGAPAEAPPSSSVSSVSSAAAPAGKKKKSEPLTARTRLLRELAQCARSAEDSGVSLRLGGKEEDDMQNIVADLRFEQTTLKGERKVDETLVREGVRLAIRIPDDYPHAPPFVRVVSPDLSGGFVLEGGGLCMEVLSTTGWSPAYTLEKLLVSIRATMLSGDVRVHPNGGGRGNDPDKAERSFKWAMDHHGWNGGGGGAARRPLKKRAARKTK